MANKMKIKVRSDTGKVYISRVVTDGPVQNAFRRTFSPLGQCVRGATLNKSHTKAEKMKILKGCLDTTGVAKGMSLSGFTASPSGYYARKRAGKVGGGQVV